MEKHAFGHTLGQIMVPLNGTMYQTIISKSATVSGTKVWPGLNPVRSKFWHILHSGKNHFLILIDFYCSVKFSEKMRVKGSKILIW